MQKNPVWFLVDDDEDDQELFIYALEKVDPSVRCTTAANGKVALELLDTGALHPDLIFLDLNMPLMGGKDFLSLLKGKPQYKDIPVVIYSTSSDQQDMEETAALGAIGFITKPAKISGLTSLLTNFIALHEEGQNNTNA